MIKIVLGGVIFLIADFVVWRKLREEYTDDEIIKYSLWLGLVIGAGLAVAGMLETGRPTLEIHGWGVVAGLMFGVVWWSRKNRWSVWEAGDGLVGVAYWVWFLVSVVDPVGSGWLAIVWAFLGIVVVSFVKRKYRYFSWYRSGKMGLPVLVGLGWYAVFEIVVAFVNPAGIYWWGLKISQVAAAWLTAFVLVAIYLRSGRKAKEDFGWWLKVKNGKK